MAFPDFSLSLYVHVPFCTRKCHYCDFYSVARGPGFLALQGRVVAQVIEEAAAFKEAMGGRWRVPTIYVGGGTPSVLGQRELSSLLGAFRDAGAAEWTVEANPETVDDGFLGACADAGVTRLSVGVQSLDPDGLRRLGRAATSATTLRGLQRVRASWKGDLGIDLIAGIPGQTPGGVRDDIARASDFGPGHVSLYQLTCEPGTPLELMVRRGHVTLNGPARDEELWLSGRDELVRRGYAHYEVSNFALPGRECRHNLRYWTLEPWLGLGPGAASTLPWDAVRGLVPVPSGLPDAGIARLSHARDVHAYARGRETLWGIEAEPVTPPEFLLEHLMMGLRLAAGIDARELQRRFGAGIDVLVPGLWGDWERSGMAQPAGERLALTARGLLLLDGLLEEAAGRLRRSPRQVRRVDWPRARALPGARLDSAGTFW